VDDTGHDGRDPIGHHELGVAEDGAFDKQLRRLELPQLVCREHSRGIGSRHGRYAIEGFASHAQRFAARRQNPQLGTATQQRMRQACGRLDQVLAVVKDEEQFARLQVLDEHVEQRVAWRLADVENRGHRLDDHLRIGDRAQLHEPDALGVLFQQAAANLQRQPGLPRAAWTQQRDHPRRSQSAFDLRHFPFATDEARLLQGRQVGDEDLQGLERREVGG